MRAHSGQGNALDQPWLPLVAWIDRARLSLVDPVRT